MNNNNSIRAVADDFISLLPNDVAKPFISLHTPRKNLAGRIADHSKEDTWDSPFLPGGITKHTTPRDGAIYAEVSRRDAEAENHGLKIYLAGPMSGIKEFNFPAFHAAAKMLRGHGHEVFNPAEQDMIRHGGIDVSIGMSGDPAEMVRVHGFSLRDALAEDTHYICTTANAIVMLPGWEGSKGARAEHYLAYALGHQILYLGGFYA